MEFITNFIVGILIVAAGAVSVLYNYKIVNSFGRNNWFEQHIGSGSTYMVFKFFSILVILFGFTMMISLHDNLISFLLSPLTNALDK